MSNAFVYAERPFLLPERRLHVRQQVRALAYVELDEGNGGIILNVGEGGLCVQAVGRLIDDLLPRMRFQLPDASQWIETSARVIWSGESKKVAGVQYVDLSEEARRQIRDWLHEVTPSVEKTAETKAEATSEAEEEPQQLAVVSPTSETTLSIAIPAGPARIVEEPIQLMAPIAETRATPIMPAAEPPPINATTAVSDFPTPDQPRDFRFTLINNRAETASNTDETSSPWALVGLLGFLALVSLAAGWAAGQGALKSAVARIHSLTFRSHTPDRREFQLLPSSAVVRPSKIEIVDSSNERWTIAFDGLSAPPERYPRSPALGNSPQAFHKAPPIVFNTWVLSPPVRSSGSTDGSASQMQSVPTLPDEPAGQQSDGGSSIISGNLGTPRPLVVPKAGPITGIVTQGELIHRVDPVYPGVAREQRVGGTVQLTITIGADGTVRDVKYVSGPRMLLDAAAEAIRKWRYAPTLLDGKPIESHREVSLVFHL